MMAKWTRAEGGTTVGGISEVVAPQRTVTGKTRAQWDEKLDETVAEACINIHAGEAARLEPPAWREPFEWQRRATRFLMMARRRITRSSNRRAGLKRNSTAGCGGARLFETDLDVARALGTAGHGYKSRSGGVKTSARLVRVPAAGVAGDAMVCPCAGGFFSAKI